LSFVFAATMFIGVFLFLRKVRALRKIRTQFRKRAK
jgi:hypothetical protein